MHGHIVGQAEYMGWYGRKLNRRRSRERERGRHQRVRHLGFKLAVTIAQRIDFDAEAIEEH